MVPGEGFEPPTFGLQNRCTTTVLTRLTATFFSQSNVFPGAASSAIARDPPRFLGKGATSLPGAEVSPPIGSPGGHDPPQWADGAAAGAGPV